MLDLTPKSGAVVAAAFAAGIGSGALVGGSPSSPVAVEVPPSSVRMISVERDQELDVAWPGRPPITFTGDSAGCFELLATRTEIDANGVPQTTFRVRNHCSGRRLSAVVGDSAP